MLSTRECQGILWQLFTEYNTQQRPPLHATSPRPAQTTATRQSRLTYTVVIVKFYLLAFIDGAVGIGGSFRPTSSWTSRSNRSQRTKGGFQLIYIHTTRQGLDVCKKMLPWVRMQQARGLGSRNDAQVCYRGRGRPRTILHAWWSGVGGGITEYNTQQHPLLHATSPGPVQTTATCQSRLTYTLANVKLYLWVSFMKHLRLS